MLTRFFSIFAMLALVAGCSGTQDDALSVSQQGGANAGADESVSSTDLGGGPIPGSQEDLIATAGSDTIYFAFDSSVLDARSEGILQQQAEWLQSNQNVSMTIEGHCDERGTREYNLALGDRRANAVKEYLVALGIDSERLLTISYGYERPVDPGHNEQAWAQNRRAVSVANLTN
ncbi:MAG: peptidoglycan-associated lipoprotein Pal [Geminicoccaceae bacterium]